MRECREKKSSVWRSIRSIKNHLMEPFLNNDLAYIEPEWKSYVKDIDIRKSITDRTSKTLSLSLKEAGFDVDENSMASWFEEYSELILECPIHHQSGSNGFNAGFEIFVIARILNPSIVIESGVLQGFTTWVIEHALPGISLYCFDANFYRLNVRSKSAQYISHDWNSFNFNSIPTKDCLVLFNDHVSQAARVIEASERGFRHLVFSDNLPVHAIHASGLFSYPTLDMVLDKSLIHGQGIHWGSTFYNFSYNHDEEYSKKVRAAIEKIIRLPGLMDETGYKSANLTYLKIIQKS